VDFGVSYFATDDVIEPAGLARTLEERGFESMFVTEHSHIPASRETPYPIGEPLPREYWRIYDPFVSLAMAAAVTEKLKLGTAICLVVERDPIITAKEVASLDRLSGGRFLFGVGSGWLLEEMRNHGTDPKRRFGIMRERVEAMKEIWTNDEAEYHGKYVDFDPIVQFPKPIQQPHPPILVGGYGPTVFDRVLGYGDEWFPNRMGDDDFMTGWIGELQERAKAEGRGSVPVSLQIPPREPERLERFEKAGVTRAVFMLRAGERSEMERKLDQFTEAKDSYLGGR
jgi:probable F420-dependent oxidoreductase